MSFEVKQAESRAAGVWPEMAVRVENGGKCFEIFEKPGDRLRQAVFGRLAVERVWALRGVTLEVARGETVGIIGRNGSGKSTLLQMICGTLVPTEGKVETCGRVAALLELGAGFHPEFTGRENVFLNARILGLSRAEAEARFERIAGFAEIGDFIERPVKTYSSGMYVRLAFAIAAHVDAEILVIDEALAVGDAFFTQKCMRFLRGFQEGMGAAGGRKGTVIFASHDAAAVAGLCQRAVWLEQGRVRQVGPAKGVNEAYLAELFGEMNRARGARGDGAAERSGPVEVRREMADVRALRAGVESFGAGGAVIMGVDVMDEMTRKWVEVAEAGRSVQVRVKVRAVREMPRPIVGFYVKDRLGQNLFGENTARMSDKAAAMAAGEQRMAEFSFIMPRLPAGQYVVAAAVAEGTVESHVQHHWVHDAYVLTATGEETVGTGLVGLPMTGVTFGAAGGVDACAAKDLPGIAEMDLALMNPRHVTAESAWVEHIPFAFAIVQMLRPAVVVELGTHRGDSYCALCQAVAMLQLETRCMAVDTWAGDAQAGDYGEAVLEELQAHHDPLYGRFSRLVRGTFAEAAETVAEGSVDLLHLDGLHTYEAVRRDFEIWLPKMSERGVVLIHDTQVRREGFGVWKLWRELAGRFDTFEFVHGYGLGVLAAGNRPAAGVRSFLERARRDAERWRRFFAVLGNRVQLGRGVRQLSELARQQQAMLEEMLTPEEWSHAHLQSTQCVDVWDAGVDVKDWLYQRGKEMEAQSAAVRYLGGQARALLEKVHDLETRWKN